MRGFDTLLKQIRTSGENERAALANLCRCLITDKTKASPTPYFLYPPPSPRALPALKDQTDLKSDIVKFIGILYTSTVRPTAMYSSMSTAGIYPDLLTELKLKLLEVTLLPTFKCLCAFSNLVL